MHTTSHDASKRRTRGFFETPRQKKAKLSCLTHRSVISCLLQRSVFGIKLNPYQLVFDEQQCLVACSKSIHHVTMLHQV